MRSQLFFSGRWTERRQKQKKVRFEESSDSDDDLDNAISPAQSRRDISSPVKSKEENSPR